MSKLPTPIILIALLLAITSASAAEADCSINIGTVSDKSIEVEYDSSSCKKSNSGIKLCLKKAWSSVGACSGGVTKYLNGKTGAYTFANLASNTSYKIKALYKKKRRRVKFGKFTTSTFPSVVNQIPCGQISQPAIFAYTGDSVKVSFQSAGGSCNPKAFMVERKYPYQPWLDGAVLNIGSGQFGTNNLLLKGVVEGLVALGLVAEENKDSVMEKLKNIQGTGHKYVALAGVGKKHQITLGGLSPKRRYYIRVFSVDAEGNIASYDANTVKTPSSGVFKKEGDEVEWGDWMSRDSPGGKGDYETLASFVKEVLTCEKPVAVECRTKSGRGWKEAGQVYRCDTKAGGVCLNAQQPTRRCLDYEVRFLCPAP